MGLHQSCCVIILCFIIFLLSPQFSYSMSCTTQKFTKNNKLYEHCNDLPHLNSYIHWSYNSKDSSLSIAFVATPTKPDGWIAWGINPIGTGMVGTQSLIAFKNNINDTIVIKTFKLNSYKSIVPGELTYSMEGVYSNNGMMVIFAIVELPKGMRELNQVWQVGSSVLNGTFPGIHDFQPENLNSEGKLDLMKCNSVGNGPHEDSMVKNRNVFALFVRPKKDHKYRFYWNMYHHGVGYGVLVLGIINVFKGLDILQPPNKWKLAYIIFLSILGGIALILEAISTWTIVLKKKPGKSNK